MKLNSLKLKAGIITLSLILSVSSFVNSQTNFQWAKRMGGNFNDFGKGIAIDASGNVYTTGAFYGPGDYDPGTGTFSLTPGSIGCFISKLTSNGNFVWAKQHPGNAAGSAIAVDGSGNSYITGTVFGGSNYDIIISKLDAVGNFLWTKQIGGSLNDEGYSIAVDPSGNVLTTGFFRSTVDFDPGAGTFTMTAVGGNEEAFVLKLDPSGNFVWAKQFISTSGSPQIYGMTIKSDGSGNVYTGGSFTGNVDFDPGTGTFTLQPLNCDMFISKLDASGNFVWVKQMPGSSTGAGRVNSLVLDGTNNILATGLFLGTTDFDPGAGTYTVASFNNSNDIFVLKLDPSGNFVWAKQMGGNNSDIGLSLTATTSGDVYTTGFFSNSGDFDPGAAAYTFTVPGGQGVFISKLDGSGNFVWANQFAYSNSSGNGIVIDKWFDVHTTGGFDQTADFDCGAGTYTITAGGSPDIFVHKMGQKICPTFSLNASTFSLTCTPITLTISAVDKSGMSGITYTWTAPSTSTITGSTYTLNSLGIYTINAKSSSSVCIVTETFAINQTPGFTLNIQTTDATCKNNGSATVTAGGTGPHTYTWSGSSSSSSVATGLAPGTQTINITDANGCTMTQTFTILNNPSPFPSTPICLVTVDSTSTYNIITWDKTSSQNVDSFFVYRETGTNIYQIVCAQKYSALSQFVDTVRVKYFPNTGDPNAGTYRYKIKTRDTCGNYSQFSPYHNTLFTAGSAGTFTWPQLYTIEGGANPVSSYVLMRDNLSNGTWIAVNSVAGTQQFVLDPNYSTYANTASWRIKTVWSINCVPSLKSGNPNFYSGFSSSYSNITGKYTNIKESQLLNDFKVYPNPTDCILILDFKRKLENTTLKLINVLGQTAFERSNFNGDKLQLDLSELKCGVYFLEIITSKDNNARIKVVKN